MAILLSMFERNQGVRMSIKVIDTLCSKTDDFKAMFFVKCNRFFLIIIIITQKIENLRLPVDSMLLKTAM